MTVQCHRNSWSCPLLSVRILTLVTVAGLVAAVTSIGCGSDEPADADGAIANVTITPESGYPDVDIAVEVELDAAGADEDDLSWSVDFGDGNSRSGQSLEGQAIHSYDDVGEYSIVVDALNNDEVADTEQHEFTVYDPVHVSVDSVNAQPANVLTGEDATISFDVHNEAASPVFTEFTVRAYLAADDDWTREDFDDGDFDSDQLAEVGEQIFELEDGIALDVEDSRNASVNAPVPDIPTGDYHGVVVLDPDNQLQTQDPESTVATSLNTVRVENLDEDLPNIDVGQLEVIPDRAFPELSHFTRAFELSNLGGADIFNVVYKTYLQPDSRTLDDDAQLVHTSDPVNLSVHQEESIGPDEFILTEPITPPDNGDEKEVYVIVEAFSEDGDIEEATTDNNVISSDEPIVISDDPVEGPDIAVQDFAVSPDSTFLDGTLEVETTIVNQGTTDVPSFFCSIYMGLEPQINFEGDPQLHNINIPGLPAGDELFIDDEITVPGLHDPGTYYFYIVCDPQHAIDQQFRGNSQALHLDPVTITDEADIDLFVDEVSLPDTADDGDDIDIEATVCVSGSNPSGTTVGELYVDSGTDVDFDDDPYKTFEVPNIDPGQCEILELQAQAQCQNFVDQFSAGVFVDAEQSLPEEDTSNNKRVSSQPLILDGQFCQCIEDDYGPNQQPTQAHFIDVAPDAPVSKHPALCVPGGCDFYTVELQQGETLLVDIDFATEQGPLVSTMFSAGGSTTMDQDDSDDHQQIRRFLAPHDDDPGIGHIFSVCAQEDDGQNYYDMDVSISPQASTVDVLPHNIELPPQDTFSVGAVFDVDLRIYNLGLDPTGPFQTRLYLTEERDEQTLGDGDDIVLGTYEIDSLAASSHRDESLEASIDAFVDDGDYYIGVELDANADLADENPDNQIGFSDQLTIETDCYDAFTPNDSFDEAASIEPGIPYANLTACASSDNYYQICAPSAHSMEATIDGFDSDDGDIDLHLYDNIFNPVDSSANTGVDSETVEVDYIDGDQCFYLRTELVTLDDDVENIYGLEVQLDEVDPEKQCNDTFSPNHNFETAASLWEALDYDGDLDRCPVDDVDYYAVQLSPESTVDLSATLDPDDQPGTLSLQLYNPSQIPQKSAETGPGQPTASIDNYVPDTTGTHYVRVSIGGDEHRITYDLDADGLPGIDLAVEDLSIGAGTYVQGDQIRFDFWLTNYGGETVSEVDYHVYLGDSPTASGADILLGDFTVDDLEPDESIEIEGQTNVPSDPELGTQYIHVIADPDDELGDVNPANNIDTVPIEIVEDDDDANDDNDGDGA